MSEPCLVVVGSESLIKRQAVEEVFNNVFGDVVVEGARCDSGVRDQPVGNKETRLGAQNRLEAAMEAVPGAAYYVAMENGIIEMDTNEWYDLAWVVVHCTASGKRAYAPTTGVLFPLRFIKMSEEANYSVTAGSLMRKHGYTSSSVDPHVSLTHGLLTRSTILTQGITAALGSFEVIHKNV